MILVSPITQPPNHQSAVIVNSQVIKASEIPTMIISQRSHPCPVSQLEGAMELAHQLQGASAVKLIQLQENTPYFIRSAVHCLAPMDLGARRSS